MWIGKMFEKKSTDAQNQTLSHKILAGAAWLMIGRLTSRLIDVFMLIILARLLGPGDFGLVAIAMSVISILEVVSDVPITQSLLRLPKLNPSHISTAFTLSLIKSAVIFITILCIAYPLAYFTKDDRLSSLLVILSASPIIRSLASPKMIFFIKNMDFRRDLFLDISGKVFSSTLALIAAIATHSYWALAIGTISSPFYISAMTYLIAPYKPKFSLSEWRCFSRFFGWGFVSQIFNSISWQLDKIFLGRYSSPALLGQYSMSSDITNIPYQTFLAPVARPLAAAMYGLSEDHQLLRRAYLKSSLAIFTVGAPIYLGLSVSSGLMIKLLFGPEWQNSSFVLFVLALSFLPSLPVAPWTDVAQALGRPHIISLNAFIELLVRIPVMWCAVYFYGIFGAACARVVLNIGLYIVIVYTIGGLLKLSVWQQTRQLLKPLFCASIMTAAIWPLLQYVVLLPPGISLIFGSILVVTIGSCVYLASTYLFWRHAGFPDGVEKALLNFTITSFRSMIVIFKSLFRYMK